MPDGLGMVCLMLARGSCHWMYTSGDACMLQNTHYFFLLLVECSCKGVTPYRFKPRQLFFECQLDFACAINEVSNAVPAL